MRYLHKLRTRTLVLVLTLVAVISAATLIPGVGNAARGYSNRLVSAMRTAAVSAPAVKAAPMAAMQDKNAQPGKPEPPSEFSVIEYNGPKAPSQNNATRIVAATTANEVEPNNTFGTANAIGTDVKVVGNVFPNADEDWFSFTAAAGDKVHAAVMTSFSANSSSDSQLRLFQSDGTTLIEFDEDDGTLGGLSSTIAGATIPSAGTFYLQVKHFSAANQLRPYELWVKVQSGAPTPEVESNDTPATANPLPASGYVSGARNPAAATEQDWYSFTANAGDTVFLSLDLDPERDNVQWNGRLGVALFGDAANQILVVDDASTGSATNPLSEAFFMTVKDAGTYFAFVDSANAATGGPTATYRLSVSVLPRTNVGVNCTTYTSTNVPQTIPTGPGIVSSTLTVPGNPRIAQIRVTLDITHTNMPDLDIHLRSPAGSDIGLVTDIGASSQTQMVMTLDDNAGIPAGLFTVFKGIVFKPELAYRLGWFNGQDAGGTWTLDIRDDTAANGGTLNGWSIEICEMPPAPSCGAGFAQTTVFSTDFESGDAGFTHSGAQDEWARGNPTFAPVTGCNSGTNCWKTDLANTYNASSSQDLLSPAINLAGLSGPITLTWAMKYQIENASFDRAFVDVQQVGGATPKRVWEWLDATMTDPVGNPTVTIQESAGWAIYRANISSFAGQNIEIRFHLDSDTTVQLAGLAIDDVTVTACQPCPAIACPSNISTNIDPGQCSAVVNYTPPVSQGCTVTCTPSSGSTFPKGTTTVTCNNGGASTCTFTVTVTDNQAPTVSCPGNITTNTAMGQCSASVTYTTPTANDNCPGATVSCSPISGSTFAKGVTTVTCTATDAANLTGSCTFTVTVNDNQAPTVSCPGNISGVSAGVVNYTTPTASDNCPGATVACSPASGSSFPVGTTTVTCTATDASNLTGSCTFTVTTTNPCTITCPANQVAWTSGTSAAVTYPAPTTGGGGCGTVTCAPASGSTFNVGTTTVTCSTTAGPSCSFTVTVNRLTLGASLADPLACSGPGNKVNGSFSATNTTGAAANVTLSATLSNIVYLPNTATATQSGSIIVLANVISWTGSLGAGQTVTVSWMGQIADNVAPGVQACSTVTATVNNLPVAGQAQACLTVNCPTPGPGAIFPTASEASDQKAGSVLVYNIYTSNTDPTKQNTRINMTNVHPTLPAFVHLFFVAEGCGIADSYVCLTANQTTSFLASDLDPGTTGYLVAVAVDGVRGCPTS